MRNHPRLHHLVALLLLAACGKSSTSVAVPTVSSVVVSAAASSVEVGLTVQFTAQAFDGTGTGVTGQTVTWSSSATSVASIDAATGLATGLTVGSTEIRATIGGVQASQTLTVTASSCTVRTDVVLSPGQYERFPGATCLLLPAGAAGDVYRVAVARPTPISEDDSNVSSVTLSLSPVVSAAAAGPEVQPAPTTRVARIDGDLTSLDATQVLGSLRRAQATRDFEMELWRRDRLLGLSASRVLPSRGPAAPALADPPATDSLFVDSGCSTTMVKRPVTRVGFSANLVIYQLTSDFSTSPISSTAATMMLDYYESYVKDMIVGYWGAVPDTDGNGRIIVVTTTASVLGDAAAFVSTRDYYSTVDCPGSNEGEVIYFDPDLIRSLAPASGSPNYYGLSVVAHEAKHVISVYHGILRGSYVNPDFNDLWIEEGTAEISAEMSSRLAWAATGGPAVNSPVTASALAATGITKENYGIVVQFAGVQRSLPSQPNSVMNDPVGAPDEHSFYDMSWLWHRVLGDGFGDAASAPQADSALFHLLTSPSTKPGGGVAPELQVTGQATFDDLFEEFVGALSLHGTGFTAPHPLRTWDWASLTAGNLVLTSGGSYLNPDGAFPWPVTATETRDATGHTLTLQQWAPFTSASYSGGIGPSGVRFHDFRSSGSAAAEIRVSGAADGIIVVTRLD
jgi:hypothetical protein